MKKHWVHKFFFVLFWLLILAVTELDVDVWNDKKFQKL